MLETTTQKGFWLNFRIFMDFLIGSKHLPQHGHPLAFRLTGGEMQDMEEVCFFHGGFFNLFYSYFRVLTLLIGGEITPVAHLQGLFLSRAYNSIYNWQGPSFTPLNNVIAWNSAISPFWKGHFQPKRLCVYAEWICRQWFLIACKIFGWFGSFQGTFCDWTFPGQI